VTWFTKRLVRRHAVALVSNPIRDKRYVDSTRCGELVAEYLTWKRASGATVAASEYEVPLARMCLFRPELQVEQWDASVLLEFVTVYPSLYGLAESSMRTKVEVPLKDFWTWATAWRQLPWNPMSLMPRRRRISPRVYDIFSQEERAKILLAAQAAVFPQRDRAIVLLFLDTGARKTDVRMLQWRDVNTADGYVVYRHRKGNKESVVEIGSELSEALIDGYHTEYPRLGRTPIPTDFVAYPLKVAGAYGDRERQVTAVYPEKPISETGLHNWWKATLETAGVPAPQTPHDAAHARHRVLRGDRRHRRRRRPARPRLAL
jgi:integrase